MQAARVLWSYKSIGDTGNTIIAILCAAIAPIWLIMAGPAGWAFFAIAAFFLILTVARNLIWRRAYRKMKKYTAPITASFSEEHVSTSSAEGNSELPWSYFKTYAETPEYVFLTAPKRGLSIIPKSAFATFEDMDDARALIAANLPRQKMRWT